MAERLLVACLCAEWCGSCRDYRATFAALAERFSADADFAWIDIEDESDALGDPDIDYVKLGESQGVKGEKANSQSEFEAALKRAPQDATLHYDLGLALKLKDMLTEAIGEFRKAAELNPQQADVRYTLGVTLWQQGDFPAAVAELQAAVRLKPDYAEAYYTLGTVLRQQGKLPEAAR